MRGSYDNAADYYRYAADFACKEGYHTLAATIFTGLGEVYQVKKAPVQVKAMIDSAFVYLHKGKAGADNSVYLRLYPLMYKYYAEKGNMPLFQAYLDSATVVRHRREERFNAQVLLRAEQEVAAQQEETAAHRIAVQRRLLGWITAGCVLLIMDVLPAETERLPYLGRA